LSIQKRAYAQNPSDMFRQSSEGAEDNAQISSFSAYSATFDVCHGPNEGGCDPRLFHHLGFVDNRIQKNGLPPLRVETFHPRKRPKSMTLP